MSQYTPVPASSVRSPVRKVGALLLLALAVMVIAGTTQANAQPIDLRSPDTVDAASTGAGTQGVDLRSPDARDAGQFRPGTSGRFQPVRVLSSNDSSNGDDWAYLAIIVAGVCLVGGAVAMTVRRRYRTTPAPSA